MQQRRAAQGSVSPGQASLEKESSTVTPLVGPGNPPMFNPAELTTLGGPVISTATQHNIYVGCGVGKKGSCWGNPEKFEADLNNSDFIKVVDQYLGDSKTNRYPVASVGNCEYMPTTTDLTDWDIQNFVQKCFGSPRGTGTSLYHVFLAKGIDVCREFDDMTEVCYSPPPDNRHYHAMCGYHSQTTSPNGKPIYYTVEPYQAVNRCYGEGSKIVDATANVLSHEMFEVITNPNVLTGWMTHHFLLGNPLLTGGPFEIGDLCAWELFNVNVGGTGYKTQQEYSNKWAACATSNSPPSPPLVPSS